MNDEVKSLADTIKPKSDQLNADDLMLGAITVTITGVRRGSADQPINIEIHGYMPYKPCKTMRRLLIKVWGDNGHEWVGRSMTLYCDPTIKYAGIAVGGIRISHVTHLEQKQSFMLTASKGHKKEHTVYPLMDHTKIIDEYWALSKEKKTAMWANLSPEQQTAINNSAALQGDQQ